MSRIALLEATTLLGEELRGCLEHGDVALLSTDPDAVGTLVEVGGSAAIVSDYSPSALDDIDLVVLCGDRFRDQALVLENLPSSCKALVACADVPPDLGPSLIAGAEPPDASDQIFVAPHPSLVLLSRLLAPLSGLELTAVSATFLQPGSIYGKGALDRMFEETKSIVAFQPVVGALGGEQVTFNFSPAAIDQQALTYVARNLLGLERLSLQIIQTGVFHSAGASVYVEMADEEDPEVIAALFASRDDIELVEPPDHPTALSSAGSPALQVAMSQSERGSGFWLWVTMDNLLLTADNIAAGLPLLGV